MSGARPISRSRTLEEWESWVDRAIGEARERGEFDNLPGHGKPLQLDDAPFSDGREIGFGILKNAGMAPYWVEVNREITALNEALGEMRDRAARAASDVRTLAETPLPAPALTPKRRWWQIFRYVERSAPPSNERAIALLQAEIDNLRRDYLAENEVLNQKIAHYNATIPRDLWHLEQRRRTPDEAAREFDVAIFTIP